MAIDVHNKKIQTLTKRQLMDAHRGPATPEAGTPPCETSSSPVYSMQRDDGSTGVAVCCDNIKGSLLQMAAAYNVHMSEVTSFILIIVNGTTNI